MPVHYEKEDTNMWLKRGVWLYVFLLIFEGALRKWALPGIAGPLLIVRDPLALWLIYTVWNNNQFPKSMLMQSVLWIGGVSILTAVLFGHRNIYVALFGARIFLIYFPLIFVIGQILNRDDVIRIGRFFVVISIPMAILIGLQFYSPQSAWVNRGIGGDIEGSGFSGALGYFRPAATFSFTNGTYLFFGTTASFLLYFWLNPNAINKFVLSFATIALITAIPLSISRSLTFHVVVVILFALIPVFKKPSMLIRVFVGGISFFLILSVLSNVEFFSTATTAFSHRFETAGTSEGGLEGTIGDRYIGGLFSALEMSVEQPFFGYGVGMGTNVGSQLISGKVNYLISEGEWGRLIGEMGPFMGISIIIIRLLLSWKFFMTSLNKMLGGDLLPWMVLSSALLILPQGQWAQPTSLGFSALICGLVVASLKNKIIVQPKGN